MANEEIEMKEELNESNDGETTISLNYGLTDGLIHTNESIIKSIVEEQERDLRNQTTVLPQINVTHEDSDEVIETYGNSSDNFETKYATLDPSYCETSSSKAYQMRRDSIRLSLQSSNLDLGNAIEVNNVSFGYTSKKSVLSNISINVPKG